MSSILTLPGPLRTAIQMSRGLVGLGVALVASMSPLCAQVSPSDLLSKLFGEAKAAYREGSHLSLRRSIETYQEAFDTAVGLNLPLAQSTALTSIGHAYLRLEQPDSALLFYRRALAINRAERHDFNTTISFFSIGAAFEAMGDSAAASESYQCALAHVGSENAQLRSQIEAARARVRSESSSSITQDTVIRKDGCFSHRVEERGGPGASSPHGSHGP